MQYINYNILKLDLHCGAWLWTGEPLTVHVVSHSANCKKRKGEEGWGGGGTQNFIDCNILEITFNRMAITSCIHRAFPATRTRISQTS